ncbi:MAG: hypothetical protein C0483_14325 [Pirellula sp.]|nr:hypothetical protein [Pirellula sp.]
MASSAIAQQFAGGYPAANPAAPRGSYYAQVASQATGNAGLVNPYATANVAYAAPAAPAAIAPAVTAVAPNAATPPSMPLRFPTRQAAPAYLPQQTAAPTPSTPNTAGDPTASKTYRTVSPLNGVQSVTWRNPRSFVQGNASPAAGFPAAAGAWGAPNAPQAATAAHIAPTTGAGYHAALLTAANQPTLAPPKPGSASFTSAQPGVPMTTSPGFSGSYGAPAASQVVPGMNYPATMSPGFTGQGTMTQEMVPSGTMQGTMPGGPQSSMWRSPVADPGAFAGPQSAYPGAPAAGPAPYADPGISGAVYDGMFDEGAASATSNWFQDPGMSGMGAACPNCGPWFASLSGLYMTRDAPNNVGVAYMNAAPQTSVLNSEQAGFDWKGGFELRMGRMIGSSWALEGDYWYLDPSGSSMAVRSDANDISSRLDMQNVFYQGSPLSDIYNNSHEQRISRSNDFQNVEINLWQQAANVDPAGRYGMAFFSGFRWFRYRDTFEYGAVAAGAEFADMNDATQSWYHIRLNNNLIGWQVGGRLQAYIGQRLRFFAVPRAGIFANVLSQQQDLCMVIDLHSTKTDVALLGQIELGAAYQIFNCCSIFASYRAVGITGVANADDQVARTFTSLPDMAQINSSGSIILHGLNTGLQFQF